MKPDIIFAIPGDMHRATGGFIYEATVLRELRMLGLHVEHLQLPAGFPDPTDDEIAETLRLLRAVPPDVAILLDGFIPGTVDPDGLASVVAPLVPIIHHPLGMETGLTPDRAAYLLRNEAVALRHARRIVVPSPHTARLLIDEFAIPEGKIGIAPPGFHAVDARPQPVTPPLILAVGLLTARKGHDVLLDALARISDLAWRAQIVGGTHEDAVADALRRQADTLGLSDRVRFSGQLRDADLDRAYDAASIFALATRFEGYGMVFGEAMLRGLPIVTCRAGAVPDTVGDAARLVAPDDAAGFAAALRDLLTDEAARERLAQRSATMGRALPRWRDTAAQVAASVRQAMIDRRS
ncbi:glycosyltransferase family 4 protein [Oceaniglobus indicus]|uniref:glycosyltransferase family 4 protein n=1 Tax=Oceaniglobus indicus TaxID=2047749 RepID=UPI000C18E28D|nr:glycosyltransferase family 4 protein [Oceaniglobus indicus]